MPDEAMQLLQIARQDYELLVAFLLGVFTVKYITRPNKED